MSTRGIPKPFENEIDLSIGNQIQIRNYVNHKKHGFQGPIKQNSKFYVVWYDDGVETDHRVEVTPMMKSVQTNQPAVLMSYDK